VVTQERQHLTTDLGFDIPPELKEIGLEPDYVELMQSARAANLKMREEMPNEAQYLVPRAFRMRWYMRMNLREAYHLTELRSMKQGHPDYRKVAQQMKSLIAEKHPLLAEYMQVDMNDYALPRIESEKRIDQKLADLDSKKDG
jgi:thymidylate synthase ThyX